MKRASDSDRASITCSPAPEVLLPVRRPRRPFGEASKAPGDRLDRRERVVDLVAEHPHEPLPRRALLGPEHAAQVGQHQQPVRAVRPGGKYCRAPPTARRRREMPPRACAGVSPSRQAASPSASAPSPSSRSAGWPSSRSPPRFTSRSRCSPSKAKTATSISSITRRSSAVASSARSRCERSVSLSVLTSSSARPSPSSALRAAGADRVVALAQRGEQVGDRLQRPEHALPHERRPDEPGAAPR